MGIPPGMDWTLVVAQVQAFMAEPLVQNGIIAVIALSFVPLLVRTIKRSARVR